MSYRSEQYESHHGLLQSGKSRFLSSIVLGEQRIRAFEQPRLLDSFQLSSYRWLDRQLQAAPSSLVLRLPRSIYQMRRANPNFDGARKDCYSS